MSKNTIKVDKDELAKQITALENLINDNKLRDKISSIQNSIATSAGSSADYVAMINQDISNSEKQIRLLFLRTLNFLKNTNTTFMQADEGLAERIKKGEEK